MHSKFFLILTGVFGAVSGVGIWFAIGLASPESTSALIHNFVFGWAMEWCFFIVEIATAIVYYYTWDRIDPKIHMRLAWLYAGTSWFTLVIINGILTFMLTPGPAWLAVAGTGQESSRFWDGLLQSHLLAQPRLTDADLRRAGRGLGAHDGQPDRRLKTKPALKAEVIRWSARWLIPAFVLVPVALSWYLSAVPDNSR